MTIYLRLIAVTFILFSGNVFSDSYLAVQKWFYNGAAYESHSAACSSANPGPYGAFAWGQGFHYLPRAGSDQSCGYWSGEGSYAGDSYIIQTPINFMCPYGGTLSGTLCISADPCPDGQARDSSGQCLPPPPPPPPECVAPLTYDPITMTCQEVEPVCVYPENPITTKCHYEDSKGDGLSCFDGKTVYPPMVCEPTPYDDRLPPTPGHPATCLNGSVVSYPQTCLDAYKIAIGVPPLNELIGLVLGVTNPLNSVMKYGDYISAGSKYMEGLFDSAGNPVIRDEIILAKNLAQQSRDVVTAVEYDVPSFSVGKALETALQHNPTSQLSRDFAESISSGPYNKIFRVETNTGLVKSISNDIALSSNQLYELSLASKFLTQARLTEISPYVRPELSPWIEPALPAIDGEWKRIYDLGGAKAPLYFPKLKDGTLTGPQEITDPRPDTIPKQIVSPDPLTSPGSQPIPDPFPGRKPGVVLGPGSPLTYAPPQPETTRIPDPTKNPIPDQPFDIRTPAPEPIPPGTTFDPKAVDTLPTPPTVHPDTFKYFDFLPMANPFNISFREFIPQLPEPSCSYEIHKTFHVPFLGNKHFDMAPCAPLQPLRAVLAWVFSVLTLFTCFFVIFRSQF